MKVFVIYHIGFLQGFHILMKGFMHMTIQVYCKLKSLKEVHIIGQTVSQKPQSL